tara:strand:- start:623 stop:1702 length:1080 start_codon:yes stop_codon:yes gene_type:complete
MEFNFKLTNLKTLYNFFLFLALFNIFFSTDYLYGKTFSVNDIEVSTPFEMNFNKNDIIDEGFNRAFKQLILSIAKSKDQKLFNQISLSVIKGMIETFSIKEEKFINEIYYLNLNVSFDKKKIFKFLESKDIFPSLPYPKKIFFFPIIIDENTNEILIFSENPLFKKWNLDKKKYQLLHYVLPSEDLEDLNLISNKIDIIEDYDFKEIIKKYNLENYIITIIFKNNEEIRVLSKINFDQIMDLNNLTLKNINLDSDTDIKKFIEKLKIIYEDYWKSKNQINTSIKLPLMISINNDNNSKVSQFEKSLTSLDHVYDFYIYKFDNEKNIYKIIFNGSPDDFLKNMKDKNYEFNIQNQIWILK